MEWGASGECAIRNEFENVLPHRAVLAGETVPAVEGTWGLARVGLGWMISMVR